MILRAGIAAQKDGCIDGCRACRLPEERRRMLINMELKAEFGDLLTWRDGIFAKHYPLAAKA